MENERRSVPRIAGHGHIEYVFPGQTEIHRGRCLDYSQKGLAFEGEHLIAENTALQVSLLSENKVIPTLHTLVKIIEQHQNDAGVFVNHAEIQAIKA